MPINYPTLALAKNHAERLHNGGGKDYGGGHGIIVDGKKIKIDEVVNSLHRRNYLINII